ncbi:hypothetical protein N7478_002262 [Penicillium angulare]|uniref:uncharacterized protein n=1 Tax=Penicillium angulare TaxID=116970 RepID=UPI0025422204|nr:uncharacterized protein N7478_002262 [Penicillium angulare]KAJ5289232.1 hypothetical protein N7478_002262 [Penicillium angulare]
MDTADVLRMLARLDTRTLRAERAQAKLEESLATAEQTLKQTTLELDQVARLAEIFYESSHKLGNMVDHLLKERGVLQNGQQPESLKAILDVVQKEIDENAEKGPDSNDTRSEPTPPSDSADQQGPE